MLPPNLPRREETSSQDNSGSVFSAASRFHRFYEMLPVVVRAVFLSREPPPSPPLGSQSLALAHTAPAIGRSCTPADARMIVSLASRSRRTLAVTFSDRDPAMLWRLNLTKRTCLAFENAEWCHRFPAAANTYTTANVRRLVVVVSVESGAGGRKSRRLGGAQQRAVWRAISIPRSLPSSSTQNGTRERKCAKHGVAKKCTRR